MAADVGQEELQAVAGAGLHLRLRGGLELRDGLVVLGGRGALADLEADPLQLAPELLDVEVAQLVFEGERLELGGLDEAALLRTLEQRPGPVGLKQFGHLVLRQKPRATLSRSSAPKLSNFRTLGIASCRRQGEPPPDPRDLRVRTRPGRGLFLRRSNLRLLD